MWLAVPPESLSLGFASDLPLHAINFCNPGESNFNRLSGGFQITRAELPTFSSVLASMSDMAIVRELRVELIWDWWSAKSVI